MWCVSECVMCICGGGGVFVRHNYFRWPAALEIPLRGTLFRGSWAAFCAAYMGGGTTAGTVLPTC